MCGRFTLRTASSEVARQLGLLDVPELTPRYNIAPTQSAAVVRHAAGAPSGRELVWLRWGLVPRWAKDASIGSKMINARAETVAEKPSYRTALRRRRCLVPADGFYEWQKHAGTRQKQPYHIARADGGVFALAGLWERWDQGAQPLETFTIITTEANELMRPLHARMPVILPPEAYAAWLDPAVDDPARLAALLRPWAGEDYRATPVSTRVNSPSHDDAGCLAPAT